MEITIENVLESLRACAEGKNCRECVHYNLMTVGGIHCKGELMRTAARMLEEIGKGELPRKPVEEKHPPTMDELWAEHERLRGRANALGGYLHMDSVPPYDNSPDSKKEMYQELAYYEGFCDVAMLILEHK